MNDLAQRATPELAPGEVVAGRYRVEQTLGEGASGTVYAAVRVEATPASSAAPSSAPGSSEPQSADPVLPGTRVALKVIHRHLLRDRQIFSRFRREARILRTLSGEHLVPLLDFGEALDGQLYMALALAAGVPLDERVRAEPVQLDTAVQIVSQICEALDEAHRAGVIHRDLKPGNVMVEQCADGEVKVRVLDFGMAKVLRGEASDSLNALTEANMVFGTPEYMAPEQARGEEVDARSDVYAAGVILYELLTGTVPFQSSSPIGTMTAHLTEPPPPPSLRARARGITPALEAVVLHALAKDPRERYASARALHDALACALLRPGDVKSTAPPALDDPALHDTDLALHLLDSVRKTLPADVGRARAPGSRLWIVIAIIAALIGIALGVIMSWVGAA